jgi:hypothetical protein
MPDEEIQDSVIPEEGQPEEQPEEGLDTGAVEDGTPEPLSFADHLDRQFSPGEGQSPFTLREAFAESDRKFNQLQGEYTRQTQINADMRRREEAMMARMGQQPQAPPAPPPPRQQLEHPRADGVEYHDPNYALLDKRDADYIKRMDAVEEKLSGIEGTVESNSNTARQSAYESVRQQYAQHFPLTGNSPHYAKMAYAQLQHEQQQGNNVGPQDLPRVMQGIEQVAMQQLVALAQRDPSTLPPQLKQALDQSYQARHQADQAKKKELLAQGQRAKVEPGGGGAPSKEKRKVSLQQGEVQDWELAELEAGTKEHMAKMGRRAQ